jgi:hypothetical protein
MVRTANKPQVATYYGALQSIFGKQSEILTAALPHFGERGRNDEERLRDFLVKVIPNRFSFGTGFIVCNSTAIPTSGQTDIVIYDEIHNSPLHRELSSYVYPIETVYGAIEVKSALKHDDVRATLVNIQKIRRLAKHKWYVRFGKKDKDSAGKGKFVVAPEDFQNTLSPRTYLFAYDTSAWSKIDSFKTYLRKSLLKNKQAHLHGVVVLSKNWFVYQEPFEPSVVLKSFADNALLRFVHKLTYDISSVPMHTLSLDKYFGISYGAS